MESFLAREKEANLEVLDKDQESYIFARPEPVSVTEEENLQAIPNNDLESFPNLPQASPRPPLSPMCSLPLRKKENMCAPKRIQAKTSCINLCDIRHGTDYPKKQTLEAWVPHSDVKTTCSWRRALVMSKLRNGTLIKELSEFGVHIKKIEILAPSDTQFEKKCLTYSPNKDFTLIKIIGSLPEDRMHCFLKLQSIIYKLIHKELAKQVNSSTSSNS